MQQIRFPHDCPDRKRCGYLLSASSLSTASVAVAALLTLQLAGPALADGGRGSAGFIPEVEAALTVLRALEERAA
jgi:hypothetical protein